MDPLVNQVKTMSVTDISSTEVINGIEVMRPNVTNISDADVNIYIYNTHNSNYITIEPDETPKPFNPETFIFIDSDDVKYESLDELDPRLTRVTPRPEYHVPSEVVERIQYEAMKPRIKLEKCTTCGIRGYYYRPGDSETSACIIHKTPDMIVNNMKMKCVCCLKLKCSYAMTYHRNLTLCHKCCMYFYAYVYLERNKCRSIGCNVEACFNYSMEEFGLMCVNHRLNNMIDIKNRRCLHDICTIQPLFNYKGQTRGIYCSIHKDPNMIDVIHTKCNYPNCTTNPTFNHSNEKTPKFCLKHKEPFMIDVIRTRCKHHNCIVHPIFNYPNETKPLWCSQHKHLNMIDVVHIRCKHQDCRLIAHHNSIGSKPQWCKEHSAKGCVYKPYRICRTEGCEKICLTGIQEPRLKLMHCLDHIQPGEIDFTQNKCNTCQVTHTILDSANNCSDCSTLGTRVELRVRTFFLQNGIQYKSHDTPLSLSGYRPDFLFETSTTYLVVEVDEHQHKNYDDEDIRMLTIAEELRKPTIFIRFNPDDYSSPCQTEFTERLQCLKFYIEKCLTHIPTSRCEKIYLFYDNWDPNQVYPIQVPPIS